MKYGLRLALGVVVALAVTSSGQEADSAKEIQQNFAKLRINLSVSGNPKVIHATHSYLAAALRKIEDVEITKDKPASNVICMVSSVGEPEVMTMAVACSTTLRTQVVEAAFSPALSDDGRRKLHEVMGPNGNLEDIALLTEKAPDWEAACKRWIADLDGRVFEKARTMLQELKERRFKFIPPADEPVHLRMAPNVTGK